MRMDGIYGAGPRSTSDVHWRRFITANLDSFKKHEIIEVKTDITV